MNKLELIIAQKNKEIAVLKKYILENPKHQIAKILNGEFEFKENRFFKNALCTSYLAIIAEIKRKSPSKGLIADIPDPLMLAKQYDSGGANAISILTDSLFFGGYIEDIQKVSSSLTLPILRKDFIIDEIQIAEAFIYGASAILCIVSILGRKTKQLLNYAHKLGLDVLVEIHNEEELSIALDANADIIGINNRNLKSLMVNSDHAFELGQKIPNGIIKVAESGISEPALARDYYTAGFNAVLIGEALVRSKDPIQFIRDCQL